MADLADLRTQVTDGMLTGTATAAVSGATVTVAVGGATVTAKVLRGLTIAANDPLLVTRHGAMWVVLGRLAASTPTKAPAGQLSPDIPTATVDGTTLIHPVETRTWVGTWRADTDDVHQGAYGGYANATGCAFYGTVAPAALSGVTVTAASVRIRRLTGGVHAPQALTLVRVTETTRPDGAPTVAASTAGPVLAVGDQADATVPTAWAQAMVDGTAGGLGLYTAAGTPYARTAGIGSRADAWVLTIYWSR
jgi:hypothetical protein